MKNYKQRKEKIRSTYKEQLNAAETQPKNSLNARLGHSRVRTLLLSAQAPPGCGKRTPSVTLRSKNRSSI